MVIIKKAVPGVSETSLTRFAQRARRAAGLRGQVNIVLTSSRDLRALNRRFRGKDKSTDVLSFPPADLYSDVHPPRSISHQSLATSHLFCGDIAISTDIATRNARLYRHAPAQELKILIVHGMLHLAGYDHESDRGEMARKEERLRRDLGLTDGLIRRTEACGSGLWPENGGRRRAPHKPSRTQPTVDRRPSAIDRRRRKR